MNKLNRFFLTSVQIVVTIALLVGIVFSAYQIWQSLQGKTDHPIWLYILLLLVFAYVLGFMIDRRTMDDIGSSGGEGAAIFFLAAIIVGGFVYYGINFISKRIYWLFNPDKKPTSVSDKQAKRKGQVVQFRKKDG